MPNQDPARWPWFRDRLGSGRRPPATPAKRGTVAIVTDSAAALPREWLAECSTVGLLTVVTMSVMVADHVHAEDEEDIAAVISVAMASGAPVKTSRPSPGQFEQAYRAAQAAGFDAVVSIHLSGELSGTVEAARLAAGRVSLPVQVVDSRTVGMAMGMAVQAAVVDSANGGDSRSVAAAARGALARTRVYFYVPSLEQLRRGGRIGAAASLVGTVLAIKPILSVEDGRIVPLEKVRSAARAVARLEELVVQDACTRPAGTAALAVHHFGNPAEAAHLAERLALALPLCPPASTSALPTVLAAHAGLGVLAVIVGEQPLPGTALST